MQKKLIALAVAAVTSGAAFAQTNVTIYGNVDMGYMFRSGSNGAVGNDHSRNDLQSGASQSHIGFKGVEDLGNGMKALFSLQYRINPDTNTGLASAGHQYVGLTGGFGTVVAGYLDGIRFGIYGKYNPFGNYSIASLTSMTTQYDRAANAIAYISPSFSGFTVVLATATNTQGNEGSLNSVHVPAKPAGGNTGDDRLLSANLIYANGPLSIDLDYETTRAVGYDRDRLYVATAGASYDFGMVKVSGLYDVIKGDVNSFIGGNTTFAAAAFNLGPNQKYDRRNWFIGATVPLGKFSVKGMFGQVKDKTLTDADAWKVGVGARYTLSKRTELYADYAHIKNDTNGRYTIGNNIGDSFGVNGLAMGVKHSF